MANPSWRANYGSSISSPHPDIRIKEERMKPKSIVAKEVARQAEFGMEPSWEDFVKAGIKEVVDFITLYFLEGEEHDFCTFKVDLWLAKLKEWGIE